jgi:WD40 repeat protein
MSSSFRLCFVVVALVIGVVEVLWAFEPADATKNEKSFPKGSKDANGHHRGENVDKGDLLPALDRPIHSNKIEVQIGNAPEMQFEQGWSICTMAFSPDSKCLACGDTAGGVVLWNLESHKAVWNERMPSPGDVSEEELDLVFNKDGNKLLVASDLQAVAVWDVTKGCIRRRLFPDNPKDGDYNFAAAVGLCSISGSELAILKLSSAVTFWNPISGKKIISVKDIGRDLVSLRASNNGKLIAFGTNDGRVLIYELPSKKIVFDKRESDYPIKSVAIDSYDEHLVAGSDEVIICWDVKQKKRLWSNESHVSGRGSLAISPNGRMLLSAGKIERFTICDIRNGEILSDTAYGKKDEWCAFAFGANGTFIATGSMKGTVAIWRISEKIKPGSGKGD